MDSASLEHLLRRGDAKVRRQGATHAATRYGAMMSMMDYVQYVQYVQIRMPPHVCLLCMSNRRPLRRDGVDCACGCARYIVFLYVCLLTY